MNKIILPPSHQRTLLSHAELVRKLYKMSLKNLRSYIPEKYEFRYEAVLLRDRFDKNKHIKDFVEAKRIRDEGFAELERKLNPLPMEFINCPGGIAYQREDYYPDYLMDGWHPDEKAQYPDYFKKRDERKKEYLERWNKKYGKSEYEDHN